MYHVLCPVGEAQNHIMILTSVKSRAKQLCSVQKLSCKHAEMTDIIVCSQIVNREIRLKMQGYHIINAVTFKRCLITVDVICPLLIDHLHIFI